MELFMKARYSIKKSVETQGKWEDFYQIYDNLDKGKNYIKTVREKFGNEEFARLLEAFKEKKHEAPIDWEEEFRVLGEKLSNQAYPLVVQPAAQALIRLFDARTKKLEQEKTKAFAELQKLILEQDPTANAKKQFLKILDKTRLELRREWKEKIIHFKLAYGPVKYALPDFFKNAYSIINSTGMEKEFSILAQLIPRLASGIGSLHDHVGSISNENLSDENLPNLFRSIYAGDKSLPMAKFGSQISESAKKKCMNSIPILRSLVATAQNGILPGLSNLNSLIKSNLKEFKPEIKEFLSQRKDEDSEIQMPRAA